VTRGGRIDYFGETIERGAALLDLSPPGGVALSSASADDRAAAAALHRAGVTREVILPDAGPFKRQLVTTLHAPRA
jgi:class 3 adenylate cyclase